MGDVVSSLINRLRGLAPSKIHVPERFKEQDLNKDNIITPEEFETHFISKHNRKPNRDEWWEFLGKDRDGDACVSIREYMQT